MSGPIRAQHQGLHHFAKSRLFIQVEIFLSISHRMEQSNCEIKPLVGGVLWAPSRVMRRLAKQLTLSIYRNIFGR